MNSIIKNMCLVLCWIFSTSSLTGQTLSIIILDEKTNAPLPMVLVIDSVASQVFETNHEGILLLQQTYPSQKLKIQYLGYNTRYILIEEIKHFNGIILLQPNALSMEEVVISASRWNQSSARAPYRIQTLNQKNLWMRQPQNAADFLGAGGRVFIQKSQQGGGSPMIRGFATNRLLYSVDGVRMNTAIFRSGNIQNVINLDGFALEKAEILFGPGAVLYGSDAIGGVMAFQTLQPVLSSEAGKKSFGAQAVVRHATANQELTGHLDVKAGTSRFGSVTSITVNRFGDLRMGRHGPADYLKPYLVKRVLNNDSIYPNPNPGIQTPSGYDQVNVMQKFLWKATAYHTLEYGFHFSSTSTYDRYDRHIRYKNGLPRYAEWQYGPQSWMMHLVTWHNDRSTKCYDKMVLRAAYQRFGESRIDRDIQDPIRHLRKEAVDAYSLNLDFYKEFGNAWVLTYGAEMVVNHVHSSGTNTNILTNTILTGPSRYPQTEWNTAAVFASAQYKIRPEWTLHGGLRQTVYSLSAKFDTTFYPLPFTSSNTVKGALTGNLGMVYRPARKTIIQASLSTGFRAPNVDDMGKVFDSTPGNVTVPNPDLRSEYAWNAEVGFTQLLGDWIRFDISAYTTLLERGLVRRPFTLNGQDSIFYNGVLSRVEAVQNAAFVKVNGIQMGIDINLAKGLLITSQYNVQSGTEELENGSLSTARQAAPNFGMSQLTWRHEKVSVTLLCQYSGEKTFSELALEEQAKPELYAKDVDGQPYSPSWAVWTLNASWQVHSKVNLFTGLENLTDVRYRPYSSGMAGAGRQLVAALRVNW